MFRIRQVPDAVSPANATAVAQVQAMLAEQLPGIAEGELAAIPAKLHDPLKYGFRYTLFIAEQSNRVRGFAMVSWAPDHRFCYLDYIASAPGRSGGGIGGALYARVREHAAALGAVGLFFEVLPDDPALSPEPNIRRQNMARLRFYERYGARPIAGTLYETPLRPGDTNPPYLCYDGLGRETPPSAEDARRIVRAILERKYGNRCPPGYIDRVVDSFRDDPIRIRPPRYARRPDPDRSPPPAPAWKIALVVNDKHDIHHVHERGYVEAPVRVRAILRSIEPTGLFDWLDARAFPDRHIRAVHDPRLIAYLEKASASVGEGKSVYPYVFPIRNPARPPKELGLRAGYWCIDTFTPINQNAYLAARHGVDCTLTAADEVLRGRRIAYALVRPPGHHAERRAFGGFCYFCNAAVAAHYLARFGRAAILDIDYHHGNGQQDIFYDRADVLTVSIHGHPSFAYPYFSGYRDESGRGAGLGANLNLPLPETITLDQYLTALKEALRRILKFRPAWLVLACGFDTAVGDPTGSWPHRADDFERIGRLIGEAGWPLLVVQEGGYRTRTLGQNAASFFRGLWDGSERSKSALRAALPRAAEPARARVLGDPPLEWRQDLRPGDSDAIRRLVASTGFFSEEEVEIAAELADERMEKGAESGYAFLLAESEGRIVAYACYGPIPGTDRRYDLYWIAVSPELQGKGVGRKVLERTEAAAATAGATRLYVDTSTSPRYAPTRAFYRRMGYRIAAEMPDFYRDGDGKTIFMKPLPSSSIT